MKLSSFVVLLTDACNFDCAYCDRSPGKHRLDLSTLIEALDSLRPYFAGECFISFYGGEPLLAFDLLRRAVERTEALSPQLGIKFRYSLTTNGSLLSEDVLEFLDDHRFSVLLSFDGLAQDLQREKGTFELLMSVVPRILARPRISLTTNSVFSSQTVGCLSDSVRLILQLGVRNLDVNLAHRPDWSGPSLLRLEDEIARVGENFLSRYANLADLPWTGLSEELDRGVHRCSAACDRMALSSQGRLWGCFMLAQYFEGRKRTPDHEKYCFGDIPSFSREPRRILDRKTPPYAALRMERFVTPDRPCLICEDIERCWVCPFAAALATGEIGRIPAWRCQAAKIFRRQKRIFLERFGQKVQLAADRSSN